MSGSINQTRVDVLGVSVDNSTTWTTMPASSANRLNTAERIVTRAINALDLGLAGAVNGTNGFADRFTLVVGEESAADQANFQALGGNLINVLHSLVTGGGGGGPVIKQIDHASATIWDLTHDLGAAFVEVRVLSPGGSAPAQTVVVPAQIEYLSTTACRLTFLEPVAGTAIVRR